MEGLAEALTRGGSPELATGYWGRPRACHRQYADSAARRARRLRAQAPPLSALVGVATHRRHIGGRRGVYGRPGDCRGVGQFDGETSGGQDEEEM